MAALDDRIRDLVEQRKALYIRLRHVEDELFEAYRLRYEAALNLTGK